MITLLLLLIHAAMAGQLNLSLDTQDIGVGQAVGMKITLINVQSRQPPQVPVGDGLQVQYQGRSTSQMMVNFKTTRTVTYSYTLLGLAEGDWQIGPIDDQVSGTHLRAPAQTVHVHPRTAAELARSQVKATLTDTRPYAGQTVVYTFRYQHRDKVLDARWTAPQFEGLVDEQTAESNQTDYVTNQDGQDYSIEEVWVPLVAVGVGDHIVPPAMLTTQVPVKSRRPSNDPFRDSFFGRATDTRTETLSTQPLPFTVRALPTQGRPADFSGLIGQFHLSAKASATDVALGDSITQEVTLTGTGTLAGFKLPPLPEDSGFRTYDDTPEIVAQVKDGRFASRATFRRAVVPDHEGELTLPPVRVSIFDPTKGTYTTVSSKPTTIHVGPGESGGEVASFAGGTADKRQEVAALGDDILPAPGQAKIHDRSLRGALPLAITLPLLPLLGLLGAWGLRVLRQRKADPWTELTESLSTLPAEPTARLAALERGFRQAAALRLGRPAPGLARGDVAPLGEGATALYEALEAARYGGAEMQDLEDRVRAFIAEVRP